ncbi:LuxR C-terminal-related transcriptional regulator [Bifidobacterium aquikefiri]|uniref:helix-turn-helix transcriptional regulator n=2 Tax=Bifidobacterium aquikefiri TaxID=1653207 RepID=UPI0039ED9029
MNKDIDGSIERMFYADIPDASPLRMSDVNLILGLRTHEDLLTSLRFRVAVLQSLIHAGKPEEAVEFVERMLVKTLLTDSIHMHRSDIAVINCNIAQAYLLMGDTRHSTDYASIAVQYARELRTEIEQSEDSRSGIIHRYSAEIYFWAQSLYACSKALAGELNEASAAIIPALETSNVAGFSPQSWPLSIALQRVSTHMQRIQATKMSISFPQQSEIPEDLFHDSKIVLSARRLVRAIKLLRQYRFQELTSVMDSAIGGTCSFSCYPVFYEMAIYLGSFALLQLNAPAAALSTVLNVKDRKGRTLSFEPLKYSAYIALGNADKVLTAAKEFLEHPQNPSVATLILIYERRSIAFEMLGMHSQACIALSRSLHLSVDVGFISPSIGIPNKILSEIRTRLSKQEPEFIERVSGFLPNRGTGTVETQPSIQVVSFTKREKVVADYLIQGFTIKKMADTLFVSTNTIKTQVRSIYKKLGVSNRSDALEKIKEFRFSQSGENDSKAL